MISGYFAPAILPQPLIRVAVHIEGLQPEWAVVRFVIDTGAALTCIHALDAIRLFGMSPTSLDPSAWPDVTTLSGIGGGLSYMHRPARFGFQRDDDDIHIIDGSVRIGELRSQSTPALLGMDVLKHFKLEMIVEPPSVTLSPL